MCVCSMNRDETQPESITDEDAVIPDGWLEDEEVYIPDPSAVKPNDWYVQVLVLCGVVIGKEMLVSFGNIVCCYIVIVEKVLVSFLMIAVERLHNVIS